MSNLFRWSWIRTFMLLWVVLLISSFPGKIEGIIFPAVSNASFEIEEDPTDAPFQTRFYMHFEKLRNCTYQGIEFYLNNRVHNRVLVQSRLDSQATIREVGIQRSGPWVVNIARENIDLMTIRVYHSCHPFWKTITEFPYVEH